MKRLSVLLVLATVFAISSVASAQEEKMKYNEWQQQISMYTAQRDSLKNVLSSLNTDIANLKSQLAGLDQQYNSEMQKYLGMLHATEADMQSFDQTLTNLTNQMNNYMAMSDQDLCSHASDVKTAGAEIDSLKAMRLALAAEFYDRMQTLENDYSQVAARVAKCSQVATYTVGTWARNRDCLWNIAKKSTIYNDPWRWPKIYIANRDQIKNPDLIYPKEVLKIPANGPMNSEEKAAARAYYARKARMQRAAAGSSGS